MAATQQQIERKQLSKKQRTKCGRESALTNRTARKTALLGHLRHITSAWRLHTDSRRPAATLINS